MLRFYISVQAVELVAISLAGVGGFVEAHIWSPAYTYYLLLALVVLDVLTNNLLTKQRLRPRQLAWRLVGYTAVLAFAHGFGEHEKGLFFLTQLVLAPFVLIHLRRLIIAFGKLGLVDSDVAELLQRRITRNAEHDESRCRAGAGGNTYRNRACCRMLTFRLDGRPHQVPGGWAELSAAQLLSAAPHLAHDSVAARLQVLRAWCPLLRERDVRRLTPEQLWDLVSLVGWAWSQEVDTQAVREFTHRGRCYRLPEPQLLDAVAVEYAMAAVFFHQFARPQRPQPAALDQLVATLCRPVRADLARMSQDPAWDGQTRERYNGKLAEARALELADAPLGVKIVVLHHFLSAQRFIHRAYQDLFKKPEPPTGPAAQAPPRPTGDGTELLELLADLAERGLYGTYEQVAHTSLHTVLFNLAKQARRRRAAEKE